jgi:ATP-binding cassette, subfamily C, bacteriocin exporter
MMLRFHACVRQRDATDCGAACLATVAIVYGLRVPVAAIRQFAGTGPRGTSVFGIVEAAKRLGFEARAVKCNGRLPETVALPCIAHVVSGSMLHYVTLHEIDSKAVTVADPARGAARYTLDEFRAMWTGVLILLTPGKSFMAADRGVHPQARILEILKPHRWALAQVFIATCICMVLGLGTSFYLQYIVDRVLIDRNSALLGTLSIGLLFVAVLKAVLTGVRGLVLATVGRELGSALMSGYWRHVLALPTQFFDSHPAGDVLSRVGDTSKIRDAVAGSGLAAAVDAVTIAVGGTVLYFYNWELASFSLVILALLAVSVSLLNRKLRSAQRCAFEGAAAVQSCMVETLSGLPTIKMQSAESAAGRRAGDLIRQLASRLFSASRWMVSANAAAEFIAGVGAVGVLWAACAHVGYDLTVGQMMAFYSVLLYLLQPTLHLVASSQGIQDATLAAERLFEVMALDTEAAEHHGCGSLAGDLPGEICFERVHFRYQMRLTVLNNLSFRIAARSVVAIVGCSGSGKTTVARLLLACYRPLSGQILLDGHDATRLSLEAIRSRIALVEQDVCLFSGTIAVNITLGNEEISAGRLARTVCEAGLRQFVDGLPDGLNTCIGERGLGLSGGQRQRLALARALVKDPAVLVLDEATSNLDPEAERAVLDTLYAQRGRRTIVLITHRLENAREADTIFVLHEGGIVEQGSHLELMAMRGRYYRMWRAAHDPPSHWAGGGLDQSEHP